jgi:3-hydroxyacyl-CoA dehydrogenase / 3-hydroxy-2-methylbutyryl-CoA dehydrogenase
MTTEKRVALVTGGASGIGKASAAALAAAGHAVMIVDIDAERGEEAARVALAGRRSLAQRRRV